MFSACAHKLFWEMIVLIITFTILEFSKRFEHLSLPIKWLPLGGMLSGFIGGLSGNQGMLRSIFLLKLGLSKEAYISTSIVSSVIVDMVRLLVYGFGFLLLNQEFFSMVSVGILGAFIGSLLGMYFLQKVTLRIVQLLVVGMLLLIGIGLTVGLL